MLHLKKFLRKWIFHDECVRFDHLKTIYNHTFQFVGLCDSSGVLIEANEKTLQSYGLLPKDVCGKRFWETKWWDTVEAKESIRQAFYRTIQTKQSVQIETKHTTPSGECATMELTFTPIVDKNGEISYVIPEGRDATQMKRIEREAHLFGELFEKSLNEFYIFDPDTFKFIDANRGALDNLGFTLDELRELTPYDIKPNVDRWHFRKLIKPVIEGTERQIKFSTFHQRKDGSTYPVEVHLEQINVGGHNVMVAAVMDMTEKQETADMIFRLAYYDSLTNLPNRQYFQENANMILEDSVKMNEKFAIFLIDLDDFKRINDSFGHHHGDELLQTIAKRIKLVVDSRCDTNTQTVLPPENPSHCNCFISRLGGDEFVVVMEKVEEAKQAAWVADQIINVVKQPIAFESTSVQTSASVGIAMYPYDGSTISSLLKSADLALYAAKERGKNQYHFHEAAMNTKVEEFMLYENAIRYFIETNDFVLHYQPIVTVNGKKKICGAEALFRGSQKYKQMDLQRIISVAEDTGLIIDLGLKIMKKAFVQCKHCTECSPNFVVSVNVSMRQLAESDFVEQVERLIENTGVDPSNISLELTETVFMTNFKDNVRKIQKLKEMGFQVSIDDFGKGYSSMSYIKQLPINKIKIDIAFIRDIVSNQKSAEIVKAIIAMTKPLGIKSCAEGVETEEQFNKLISYGCDQIQGYYSGKPMESEHLELLIEKEYQ